MLREAYILVEINLERIRDKILRMKKKDLPKFKVRDLVLLKNHKQNWDVKYRPNFQICIVINDRAYKLQDPSGHVTCATVADIQSLMTAEYIVNKVPDIKAFCCMWKYINDPSLMPYLKWQDTHLSEANKLDKNLNTTKHSYKLQPQNGNHK